MTSLLDNLRLMLITDRRASSEPLVRIAESALRGGATSVMLREKDMGTKDLFSVATDLRAITSQTQTLLIINDRLDVALAAKADGIHLGWQSLPIRRVREIAGTQIVIGASTHSLSEAISAQEQGADYITFGPVFPTPSKEGLAEVQGTAGLRAIRETIHIPIVGLGGISAENAREVIDAGADGVAVIRALMEAADPEAAARRITAELPLDR